MTVEELLKNRYKVIADYPNTKYSVGQILTVVGLVEESGSFNGIAIMNDEGQFDKYPAIFKKMDWWEDRKQEEMPEYIKSKIKVKKVTKWEGRMAVFNQNISDYKDIEWMPTGEWLPATLEEYQSQNSKPLHQ